jgi:hypothetical protein
MGLVSAFNAVHNDSSRRDKPFVTINYVGFLLLFWRANFSVTKRAHSPERFSRNRVRLSLLTAAPLAWTRSRAGRGNFGKVTQVQRTQPVQRLGGPIPVFTSICGVITGTNVPLKDLVAAGKMRSDFYSGIDIYFILYGCGK